METIYQKDIFDSILRTKSREDIYLLAFVDPLTKVNTRTALEELRKVIDIDSEAHFVSIVDIDHLKHFNDIAGHSVGDIFISNVASQLKKISSMVFRLGGDEFLCLDNDAIDLSGIAGISFGTVFKPETVSLSEAMHAADNEMRFHKNRKGVSRSY